MADILLTDKGDLRLDHGDIAICGDNEDIIQQAINTIHTTIGENPFHPSFGKQKNERIKYTERYLDGIEEACTNAILLDDRVDDVVTMNAQLYNGDQCYIEFTIVTIEGIELSSTCDIEL